MGQLLGQSVRELETSKGFQPGIIPGQRLGLTVLLLPECQNTVFQPLGLSGTAYLQLLIFIAGQLSGQKILHNRLFSVFSPLQVQIQPPEFRRSGGDLSLFSSGEMSGKSYSIHRLLDFLANQLGQGVQQDILPQEFVGAAAPLQHSGVVGTHVMVGHLFPLTTCLYRTIGRPQSPQ